MTRLTINYFKIGVNYYRIITFPKQNYLYCITISIPNGTKNTFPTKQLAI